MTMLTDVQKAYIAGIIDGEGCICISKTPQGKYINYNLKVIITTVDFVLVEWFIKNTNSKVYSSKSNQAGIKKSGIKSRQTYRINFQNDSALEILEYAFDYMVIKKERASFILKNYPKKFERCKEKRDFVYKRLGLFNQRIINSN